MEFDVASVFPNSDWSFPSTGCRRHESGSARGLILAEEAEYTSLGHSNIGGWHSRPKPPEPPGSGGGCADLVAHLEPFLPCRFEPNHIICVQIRRYALED